MNSNETGKQFPWNEEFDSIRSFHDSEVPHAIKQLKADPDFNILVDTLVKHETDADTSSSLSKARIFETLGMVGSLDNFQAWLKTTLLPTTLSTFSTLGFSGLEKLDPSKGHIFVSNHHDIVMDPLVCNLGLISEGFTAAHCAIGDNLLFNQNTTLLAKLNRCFRVKRSLNSPRELLKALKLQSAYINYLRFEENQQVWIAQKEGRSKNNIDETNPALIKMLMLAKPKEEPPENFLERQSIVPVAISYEWDPCDIGKARQVLAETSGSGYQKSKHDDLEDIRQGLLGNKGRIHVAFGPPIRPRNKVPLNRYEVADQIDEFIAESSYAFASHFAAFELTHGEIPAFCSRTQTEIDKAKAQFRERLAGLDKQVQERVLAHYAQVVLNQLNQKRQDA